MRNWNLGGQLRPSAACVDGICKRREMHRLRWLHPAISHGNSTEPESEMQYAYDPFHNNVLPFLIPPFLILVIAAIITFFGSGLLQLGKSSFEIGPIVVAKAVVAAVVGIVVIRFGALWIASQPDRSPPSSRETVSHRAEH